MSQKQNILNSELADELFLEKNKNFTMLNNDVIDKLIINAKLRIALVLYLVIKKRAMFSDYCLIGDYKNYGLTEYEYRRAKQILTDLNLCSFRSNKYGTVARILKV